MKLRISGSSFGCCDAGGVRMAVAVGVRQNRAAAQRLDLASEATLGLLGSSAQPPQTSLGKMIVEAFSYITLNWTQVLFPGLVLALLVLALSFVGDGLQEYVERG